ncbi:hypothetical protein BCR36DRAFT_365914 [Piromyces finnis]|uniref:C2H2-type domain-containing protein n=1 Tax=Piromyces finnis TaxID=1754191 RepID=A0A1Y1VLU6_9FUNG|nr:hypothetical protein BCR36DRAFT_365914 [Piromyces finnis]|eukprot:ORX59907.1 hypothetical protein BCR36DRAFT_365914 [Piromyces finnis]
MFSKTTISTLPKTLYYPYTQLSNIPSPNFAYPNDHGKYPKEIYQCPLCLKSFDRKEVLYRHIRFHSVERPYKCSFLNCNKRFSRKDGLKHHEQLHYQKLHKQKNEITKRKVLSSDVKKHASSKKSISLFNSAIDSIYSNKIEINDNRNNISMIPSQDNNQSRKQTENTFKNSFSINDDNVSNDNNNDNNNNDNRNKSLDYLINKDSYESNHLKNESNKNLFQRYSLNTKDYSTPIHNITNNTLPNDTHNLSSFSLNSPSKYYENKKSNKQDNTNRINNLPNSHLKNYYNHPNFDHPDNYSNNHNMNVIYHNDDKYSNSSSEYFNNEIAWMSMDEGDTKDFISNKKYVSTISNDSRTHANLSPNVNSNKNHFSEKSNNISYFNDNYHHHHHHYKNCNNNNNSDHNKDLKYEYYNHHHHINNSNDNKMDLKHDSHSYLTRDYYNDLRHTKLKKKIKDVPLTHIRKYSSSELFHPELCQNKENYYESSSYKKYSDDSINYSNKNYYNDTLMSASTLDVDQFDYNREEKRTPMSKESIPLKKDFYDNYHRKENFEDVDTYSSSFSIHKNTNQGSGNDYYPLEKKDDYFEKQKNKNEYPPSNHILLELNHPNFEKNESNLSHKYSYDIPYSQSLHLYSYYNDSNPIINIQENNKERIPNNSISDKNIKKDFCNKIMSINFITHS